MSVGSPGEFESVFVGPQVYACGLRPSEEVECWGYGDYVYGEKTGQRERFTSIEGGGWHACGLRSNGKVVCWNLETQAPVLPAPTKRNGTERKYSLSRAQTPRRESPCANSETKALPP